MKYIKILKLRDHFSKNEFEDNFNERESLDKRKLKKIKEKNILFFFFYSM